MKLTTSLILGITSTLFLASCVDEASNLQPSQDSARGTFSLSMATNDGIDTELTTRAQKAIPANELKDYLITLTRGSESIWDKRVYSGITTDDYSQQVATGYVVTAESCSEEQAVAGMGKKRYVGSSAPFSITENGNTSVAVECSMANAGFCVVFDDSFTAEFTQSYSVTTKDIRALVFNSTNRAIFAEANGTETFVTGDIAYYNTNAEGGYNLTVTIAGSNADGDVASREKSVELAKGKTTRLTVKYTKTAGTLDLNVTYDDEFSVVDQEISL